MLLSYDQALELVEKEPNFRVKTEVVDGLEFHIFTYMLSISGLFREHEGCLEMRGLTFCEGERFLSIPKFFNVGEIPETQVDVLRGQEIIDVKAKEDGSLIIPILVDGVVRCKTKGTFFSEQAIAANDLISVSFVKRLYAEGKQPFFEYVGPTNKIVLDYDYPELRLIQIRDRETGAILPFGNYTYDAVEGQGYNIDKLMLRRETAENIEGWVVTYDWGQVKVKTQWYVDQHRLLDELSYENHLIRLTLEGKIDDMGIPESRIEYIEEIGRKLVDYISTVEEAICTAFTFNGLDRKEFALRHGNDEHFSIMMSTFDCEYDSDQVVDLIKVWILRKTYKLEKAKEFLCSC